MNKLRSFTHDGERHFFRCEDSPGDANFEVKKALLIRDLEEGKRRITKRMTVSAWSKEFLRTYIDGTVSESVYKDHVYRLNSFILPEIGHMRLCDVSQIHCQRVMNRLQGFSEDRAKKVLNTLNRLLTSAKSNNLLLDVPVEGVKLPEVEPNGTHRPLTDFERKYTLLVSEYHRAGPWVLLMLYAGLRPQETAALQGRHVDLKNGVLHVENALKKSGEIGRLKGAVKSREVPISEPLREVLLKMELSSFEHVFKNQNGYRLTHKNMSTMWQNFKREMQIQAGCGVYRNELIPPFPIADDLVPYCYRHTFCTDLQDAGVPLNIAKDLMGHVDIRMTAKIYTTLTKTSFNATREAMNLFILNSQSRSKLTHL